MNKDITQYAPVALFAYKRLEHLKKCIKALEENLYVDKTDLFIFIDGPKTDGEDKEVQKVREYVKEYTLHTKFNHVEVEYSLNNRGLANSIITGVTKILSQYHNVIVVEDDIYTSKDFLQYMNGALSFYESNSKIGSISAYTYPIKRLENYSHDVYFLKKGDCWGWATWEDRWKKVDWDVKDFDRYKKNWIAQMQFDKLEKGLNKMLFEQMQGKIDSWAVRWCYHLHKNHLLTVYPKISRTYNGGNDGTGTHCIVDEKFGKHINQEIEECFFEPVYLDNQISKQVSEFMSGDLKKRVSNLFKKYF